MEGHPLSGQGRGTVRERHDAHGALLGYVVGCPGCDETYLLRLSGVICYAASGSLQDGTLAILPAFTHYGCGWSGRLTGGVFVAGPDG